MTAGYCSLMGIFANAPQHLHFLFTRLYLLYARFINNNQLFQSIYAFAGNFKKILEFSVAVKTRRVFIAASYACS